jgi:predicted DNA-binding transcriptional regulator AlpA
MTTNTQAQSVNAFCEEHGFSTAMFYKLLRQGKGPKTIKVGRRRLVTSEAADEWRKAMQAKT